MRVVTGSSTTTSPVSAEGKVELVTNWLYRIMYTLQPGSGAGDADSESGQARLRILHRRVAEAMLPHLSSGTETPHGWLLDAVEHDEDLLQTMSTRRYGPPTEHIRSLQHGRD